MTTNDRLQEHFATAIPTEWFSGAPHVTSDNEEILCVGSLPAGQTPEGFREATREDRVRIALEAEALFFRRVSWGVEHDGRTYLFTTYNAPVATRLRLSERLVLDTLVDAGVARSRSDALGWCVRLVARNQSEWLAELRGALEGVEKARAGGPGT
jgi:hypothetical protein